MAPPQPPPLTSWKCKAMKNAVNTIARGIEAGALKTGASQYLEAIEAAQRELKDGEMLIIGTGAILAASTQITLLKEIENPIEIERIDAGGSENIIAYFPPNMQKVGGYNPVFDNPQNAEIHLGKKVQIIGDVAFPLLGNKQIEWPEALIEIGAEAFSEARFEGEVVLPQGLLKIGQGAFLGVVGAEIHIPNTVTEIGRQAFGGVPHIYYNGPATWQEDNLYWGAEAMN